MKERGDITADTMEILRILRHNYEQLYTNTLDNLEEMDRVECIWNCWKLTIKRSNNPVGYVGK